ATIIKVLGGVERSTPPVSARKAARPSRPAAAKTAPVKQPPPPPPPYTVEIFKGATKSTQQFAPEK
ncbi:MAG: hypothetical protein NDI77_06510, partial [Geobacteraceae bacterium]|nr:hypothetical protein [Geobacteraceae bacterium]